jgi:Zn-dependent protease with chaperone function
VADSASGRLQVHNVELFVARSNQINAYTFGLTSPKVVVLNSALFQIMDADEIAFIMGHEMGHVKLGHTWLNTLVGGMAGIPSPSLAFAILHLAFRWWNRACEFSADRAGLLACSKPHKAISALIKISEGDNPRTKSELERALARIDAEDDDLINNISELLATHPMIIKRIQNLRDYTKTSKYQRLQSLVNQNLTL